MLKSLLLAFATYSAIPVPHAAWDEKAMRRAVCFFPLIGAVIGALEVLWALLCERWMLSELLRGAVAFALPLLVTGGIHMDGFCDTVDALSSHQSRERKLEILKDPHTGAFAIIYGGVYLLCSFAAWCVLPCELVPLAAVGFVLSRTLSGWALANWQPAKKDGMLRTFSDAADQKAVNVSVGIYTVLCIAALLLLGGVYGALVLAANGLMLLIYRVVSHRAFGGVTGDLAGWFLQLAELSTVFLLAFAENFM